MKHIYFPTAILWFVLFLGGSSYFATAQTPPYTLGNAPQCMKTDTLTITSGYNYRANSWVAGCGNDPYWAITSSPNGETVPMCAQVYGPWVPPPPFNFSNGWQAIGVECSNSDVQCNSLTCNNLIVFPQPMQFYTFQRQFYVDIPVGTTIQATINDTVAFDDRISNFFVNGVDLGPTPCATSGGTAVYNNVVMLNSGINSIVVNILNRGVALFPANPMRFAIRGTISTANPDIINNQWFVPNTTFQLWGCANQTVWVDTPRFAGNCFLAGVNTDTIVITNAVTGVVYNVTPGGMLPGGTSWIGTNGVTYTVTATDAMGCTISNVVTATNMKPILTITPAVSCTTSLSLSAYTYIDISASGGGGSNFEFNYLFPNNIYIGTAPAGTIITDQVWPGKYVVHVINENGCENIDSAVYNYVEPPTALVSPDVCIGEPLTVEVTNSSTPSIPPSTITYNWSPPVNSNLNPVTFTPTALGASTYTCTASSSFGCTASAVVTNVVHAKPVISVSTDNAPCNPSFTATSNTNLLGNWSWVGFPNVNWSVFNQPSMTVNAPPNTSFPNLQTNNYTVYLTDVNGCKDTFNGTYNEKPFCCNVQQLTAPGTKAFSSHASYNNSMAADIINEFTTSTISTPNFILFDGIITIDQNISFNNCPKIRFTPQTIIRVVNGATLSFNNCDLRSSCPWMWNSIQVGSAAERIIIENTTIRDMEEGVMVSNGANLKVTDSKFENNYIGLQIVNAPINYNVQNGNCVIRRTIFESDGITNLLPPFASQLRGEFGIRIDQSKNCEIGTLVYNEFNTFRNLYCGIGITQRNNDFVTIEHLYLNNNKFENIQDEPGLTSNLVTDFQVANSWPSPNATRGCAIHASPILPFPIGLTDKHRVVVEYNQDLNSEIDFWQCDKAMVGLLSTALIRKSTVEETLLGFMFQQSTNQKYVIRDNRFGLYDQTNILEAIYINASNGPTPGDRDISFNTIRLRDNPVTDGTTYFYPVGISTNNLISGSSGINVMRRNNIGIFAEAGCGIRITNGGPGTNADGNQINIYTGSPTYAGSNIATGIFVADSKAIQLIRNEVTGNSTLLSTLNDFSSIRMMNSTDCYLECNDVRFTRIGLHILGNCSSPYDRIRGNHFYQHGNGIRFGDFIWGTTNLNATGSFGIANGNFNPALDNNNTFALSNLFNAPLNKSVFSCTNSSLPSGQIFSTTLPITTTGGFPNPAGAYLIATILTTNVFNDCPVEENFMISSFTNNYSITEANDIANGNYPIPEEQPESVEWMIDRELFEQLEADSVLRHSSIVLENFYNTKLATSTDEIAQIDRLIVQMSDSLMVFDSSAVNSLVNTIETLNNSIGGSNTMELNEKFANRIFIQFAHGGMSNIANTDLQLLAALAKSCPYINGTAVYKARSLYDNFEPHFLYNDVALCQAAASNKNSTPFEATINTSLLENLVEAGIVVHPNPADNLLQIDWLYENNKSGSFRLYDITGRLRIQTSVESNEQHLTVRVENLEAGLYVYKLEMMDGEIFHGKITIK